MTPLSSSSPKEEIFSQLCQIIADLRHPDKGCPWDLKQTHQSLRKYMIEEAYEAVQAMGKNADPKDLTDELGDVLLQVLLHCQIAQDEGRFSVSQVMENLAHKMVRRHPHVFKNKEGQQGPLSDEELAISWQEIKDKESNKPETSDNVLQDFLSYPATTQALKLGKFAKKMNFDWHRPEQVMEKFHEEVEELQKEFDSLRPRSIERMKDEIGDLYFCLGQLCRHLKLDPEETAFSGNEKFSRRFSALMKRAKDKNIDMNKAGLTELEALWQEVKEEQKKGSNSHQD